MTTPTAGLRPAAGALLALALIVFSAPWNPSQVVLAQSQVLFVSLVDASGEPVTDLEPDELIVQWDGEDCETLDLEPIDWPVRVTVFIDNGEGGREAVPHMREGLKGFVDAIPDDVEIALLSIAGRPRWLTRHTTDRADLAKGINLVMADGSAARFLDALIEEAGRLRDDEERQYFPVLVMVASDGPEGSTVVDQRIQQMLQRMVENSATVHTLMFSHGNQSAIQVQVGMNVGDATRGTYESLVVGTGFRTMLPELAREIARKHKRVSHQYRVTYAPPEGASDQPAISVTTTRPGVELFPTIDGNVP